MKIISGSCHQIWYLETGSEHGDLYKRCGSDSWYVEMGQAFEPVFHCEELEAAFQEYLESFKRP